jgi:hypothetical protein
MNNKVKVLSMGLSLLALAACTTMHHGALENDSTKSQVQKRDYESRVFDTADKLKVMQSVVATLQDLDFVINKADVDLGIVSAVKLDRNREYKMTVLVRKRGTTQIVVRANASSGSMPIEDPLAFQNFFKSLSQAMFLDAKEI